MKLSSLSSYLAQEFTYPVDLSAVLEEAGDIEVEAPNSIDSQTIRTILTPLGTESFESADVLYDTIFGNVSDEYIGRKYYDDRGGNQLEAHPGPVDELNQSF